MYGLNEKDLQLIQEKHNYQREYLKNSEFETSSGQIKTLLDVSFSANHSPRYYTELLNKINTINDLMNSDLSATYKPVFITITLDGFYRGFLKGDFSRYDENKHKKQIPNNDYYGHLKDKIKDKKNFTIKDLYNCLNFQLHQFRKSQIFKEIKENNHKIHYIRVAEPHKKDGVPHLHLMMYVPEQYVERLKDFYVKYFPAPQNIKPLNKKSYDGQLKGFQFNIKSAPAYILKYIFKSFIDVKNNQELDYLQAWYIKNRILRVVTSHSIIPAWVYRKMIPIEKDWYYLTDVLKYSVSKQEHLKNKETDFLNGFPFCEWSKDDDYISFTDEYNRTLEYKQGVYKIFSKDRLIKEFGKYKEVNKLTPLQQFKRKYKKINKNKPLIKINNINYKFNFFSNVPAFSIMNDQTLLNKLNQDFNKYFRFNYIKRIKTPKIYMNGKEYIMQDNKLEPLYKLKPIKYRTNYDLYLRFRKLEISSIDDIDLNEYALIKNELIKRNQIKGHIISPNDYNSSFTFN